MHYSDTEDHTQYTLDGMKKLEWKIIGKMALFFAFWGGGQIHVCVVGRDARYKYYNFYSELQEQQDPSRFPKVKESCHGE